MTSLTWLSSRRIVSGHPATRAAAATSPGDSADIRTRRALHRQAHPPAGGRRLVGGTRRRTDADPARRRGGAVSRRLQAPALHGHLVVPAPGEAARDQCPRVRHRRVRHARLVRAAATRADALCHLLRRRGHLGGLAPGPAALPAVGAGPRATAGPASGGSTSAGSTCWRRSCATASPRAAGRSSTRSSPTTSTAIRTRPGSR